MSDPRYAADENSAFGDSSYVDALVVAATVMGALIGLVILKFFVDFLIDLLILRDGNESPVQRIMGRLFRKICPCWHRRTQPDEDRQETDNNNEDVEAGRFFRSRPEIERKAIIATILPTKILSKNDILNAKKCGNSSKTTTTTTASTSVLSDDEQDDQESKDENFVCSICLVDFEIGDNVVASRYCSHIHHKHCITEWLVSHGMDCPYCRAKLVSVDSIRIASSTWNESIDT